MSPRVVRMRRVSFNSAGPALRAAPDHRLHEAIVADRHEEEQKRLRKRVLAEPRCGRLRTWPRPPTGGPTLMFRASTTLAFVLAAAAVAGCGSSSNDNSRSGTTAASKPTNATGGGATTHLTNEADEDGGLYFEKKKLSAKAGQVTLTMENPKSSGKSHGIAIEGNGVDKDGKTVHAGGKSTVTVKLKPGRYSFYCPVPGHEQAGMKGTLLVQ